MRPKPSFLLAALLLSTVVACDPVATEPPRVPTPPVAPSADIPHALAIDRDPEGAKRIAADVTYLASPALEGRGTGEPGAVTARDFVAKRFADLGLEALGDANGSNRAYLQAFRARVGAVVAPAEVAFHVDPLKPKKDAKPAASITIDKDGCIVADGSASGAATGQVVFASYGVTAPALQVDDYAGVDASGKIVVVLDGAPPKPELRDFGSPRYKIRTAREHGAAGVVIVAKDKLSPPPNDASGMGLPAVELTEASAKSILDFVGASAPEKADKTDKKAKKKPAPTSAMTIDIKVKIDPKEADSWNVVGLLPARVKTDQYVVVGAHYDHLGHGGTSASRAPGSHEVHPGADDNASGTALMLEVARRFRDLKERPDRNVLFVGFGAEELGTIGSRWFVDHPPVPITNIVAMLNADMVGRLRENRVLVDGLGTAKEWEDLVKKAGEGLGLEIAVGSEGFGASDHATFTGARVPVAFFFTGAHEDYHRPSDTADKINAEGEERIATMAARLALAVTTQKDRMAFVDAPADPHRGVRGGFKVSLGTLPDYGFQGPGLKLTGVRPDAPAARAGLQGGDVIVKLGGHDVTNIHDYMFALGDLEPGRETTVDVMRDGKRLTLKIVPAPGR